VEDNPYADLSVPDTSNQYSDLAVSDSPIAETKAETKPAKSSTQTVLDEGASKVRQFIGKAFMAGNSLPSVIAEQLTQGTLTKPNNMESTIGTMIDGVSQTASFGIPKAMTKKILESSNLSYPEAEDKTSENIGKIIGLVAPTQAASTISKSIPGLVGKTMAKDFMRGVSEGAFVGFTEAPDNFMDIKQRVLQGGVGAAIGGVAVPVTQAINKVAFKSVELAKEVRASLFDSKRAIGARFETQLEDLIAKNPTQVVNGENAFTELQAMVKDNTRLVSDIKSGLKRSGSTIKPDVIDGFIKDPSTASQMTLNQTRELKQAIANIPSVKSNYAKGKFANWSDHEVDLIDFADHIKKSQLDAFPQLEQINKTYSDMLNKYNSVKSKFKVGVLLDNMARNFGDKEVQATVRELLPKSTIDSIGGYRSAIQLLRAAGWVGVATGGVGLFEGGVRGAKKFFGG